MPPVHFDSVRAGFTTYGNHTVRRSEELISQIPKQTLRRRTGCEQISFPERTMGNHPRGRITSTLDTNKTDRFAQRELYTACHRRPRSRKLPEAYLDKEPSWKSRATFPAIRHAVERSGRQVVLRGWRGTRATRYDRCGTSQIGRRSRADVRFRVKGCSPKVV
jgi:hypothetical protein